MPSPQACIELQKAIGKSQILLVMDTDVGVAPDEGVRMPSADCSPGEASLGYGMSEPATAELLAKGSKRLCCWPADFGRDVSILQ